MLAWVDDEALARTIDTGRATYWSRSRREYWVKGDTSGHVQWVKEVRLDCDGDTLLFVVDQVGAACHTGDHTCFDADLRAPGRWLTRREHEVDPRRAAHLRPRRPAGPRRPARWRRGPAASPGSTASGSRVRSRRGSSGLGMTWASVATSPLAHGAGLRRPGLLGCRAGHPRAVPPGRRGTVRARPALGYAATVVWAPFTLPDHLVAQVRRRTGVDARRHLADRRGTGSRSSRRSSCSPRRSWRCAWSARGPRWASRYDAPTGARGGDAPADRLPPTTRPRTSTSGRPSTRAGTRPPRLGRAPRTTDEGAPTMAAGHGNTPAAWTAVGVAMLGFVVGSVALLRSRPR